MYRLCPWNMERTHRKYSTNRSTPILAAAAITFGPLAWNSITFPMKRIKYWHRTVARTGEKRSRFTIWISHYYYYWSVMGGSLRKVRDSDNSCCLELFLIPKLFEIIPDIISPSIFAAELSNVISPGLSMYPMEMVCFSGASSVRWKLILLQHHQLFSDGEPVQYEHHLSFAICIVRSMFMSFFCP